MPKINHQQAKEFLDNISKEDKVAIIHHDDSDGFASGILFYDFCIKKGTTPTAFTCNLGKTSFKEFDLDRFDKILIADLAPWPIKDDLELIKDKEVLYTDHHPAEGKVPEGILEYRTTDQGYIPSSRTVYELVGGKEWLGQAGTVSDAGHLYPENEKFIGDFLRKENITIETFNEKITSIISNTITYFKDNPDKAFEILKELKTLDDIKTLKEYSEPIEDEIQKFVEGYETEKERLGNVNFFYFEPKFSVKNAVIAIISRKTPDETHVFATTRGKGLISISARDSTRKRSMPDLLRAGIEGLEKATAGGHVPAAGGIMKSEDLDKFKENIRKFASSK